uniref:Tegument protein UL24 n=1 Tax=Mastomys natalensis cytomegalovirus 1 TaxID=2973541 RepID=A0A9Y1IQI5_9BETA|nr:tegument protein UL24 [Mastomys natalensis cytomegalovirus 1]WEG71115.1 tegument protein UL24 [Mastomys natalensis cytomegalovirus 1]
MASKESARESPRVESPIRMLAGSEARGVMMEVREAAHSADPSIVRACLAKHEGVALAMSWPIGTSVLLEQDIGGWEEQPDGSSKVLKYFCCDFPIFPVGRVLDVKTERDVTLLIDMRGRAYVHAGFPDDAVYLLATSSELVLDTGLRYYYPMHCFASPVDIGMVLIRLWMLIRRGADDDMIARYIIRAHRETTPVAREMISGCQETLRVCSLKCLRWYRAGRCGDRMKEAECPSGDDNMIPLGRVMRTGMRNEFGIPVFLGRATGRVFAGDLDDGSYVLVADSVAGFAGVGVSRFFENRRYCRRDLPRSVPDCERHPACVNEF